MRTSATGMVTIFSGNPNTAALDAKKIVGATGGTRCKTYNASVNDVNGTVGGTRNYYYRAQPQLNVSNVSAVKTYDATNNRATAPVTATLAGVEGDQLDISTLNTHHSPWWRTTRPRPMATANRR